MSWFDDICKSFESVRREVDEVVNHDPIIKYMETKMQNVGENVMKFYGKIAEVVVSPIIDVDQFEENEDNKDNEVVSYHTIDDEIIASNSDEERDFGTLSCSFSRASSAGDTMSICDVSVASSSKSMELLLHTLHNEDFSMYSNQSDFDSESSGSSSAHENINHKTIDHLDNVANKLSDQVEFQESFVFVDYNTSLHEVSSQPQKHSSQEEDILPSIQWLEREYKENTVLLSDSEWELI